MDERLLRARMLLGESAMEKLGRSSVAVVGLGGVGSWCAEALARSGVGRLILLDMDSVSVTNLNRQSQAVMSTVGMAKTAALSARLIDAAPDMEQTLLPLRYEAASREALFSQDPDHIADCIDLVTGKLDLIETALSRGVPVISAMGSGNKLDARRIRVSDISETMGCPLARVMRRELRKRGIEHTKVVWSDEPPISPQALEAPPEGRRSLPGSVIWVPAAAGLIMAQEIIHDLLDFPSGQR